MFSVVNVNGLAVVSSCWSENDIAIHGVDVIAGGDAPWISSAGVLFAGFSCGNYAVVLLVTWVVVPVEMDVFSSAVEELKADWFITIDRSRSLVQNNNDSAVITRALVNVRNPDILAVDDAVVWWTTSGHPWMRSVSVEAESLSYSKACHAHFVALVIDPEKLNLLVGCIVEVNGYLSVPKFWSVLRQMVIDVNHPSIVFSFRNKDSFTIHSEVSASSNYTPRVRGVSILDQLSSCGDSSIADLVAWVIMPEEFDVLFTLIAERDWNWFIACQRLKDLLRLGQFCWCKMIPGLN